MSPNKSNSFGALRLLFAVLVILSHSPDLIDGNPNREILYHLAGTMTLGVIAVDGFFLISGYLICQSFCNSKDTWSYLIKRVLRIYPAFVVIWVISVFVITPLAGGWQLVNDINASNWVRMFVKIFALSQPHVEGVFSGNHHQTLNGSMWTIRYEFLCYLSISLIAAIGLTKRNIMLLILFFLSLHMVIKFTGINYAIDVPFPISMARFSRLFAAFLIGIAYYQFRDLIVWSKKISTICCLLIAIFIFSPLFAELAILLFGSYLLFNFAFNSNNQFIQKIGTKNDISYGVYIYAWPVQSLMVQHYPAISPWALSTITIIVVALLGYVSWIMVERPFINLKKKLN